MNQSPTAVPHTSPVHIGYGELEDLTFSTNGRPFYAMPLETSRPAGHGMTRKTLTIRVSQVRDDGVHHCNIEYAELLYTPGGQPFDPERAAAVRKRFDAAWDEIFRYLTQEEGCIVQTAAVAVPADLTLVNGWAKCLNKLNTSKGD